jgi:hypothetical protein
MFISLDNLFVIFDTRIFYEFNCIMMIFRKKEINNTQIVLKIMKFHKGATYVHI